MRHILDKDCELLLFTEAGKRRLWDAFVKMRPWISSMLLSVFILFSSGLRIVLLFMNLPLR